MLKKKVRRNEESGNTKKNVDDELDSVSFSDNDEGDSNMDKNKAFNIKELKKELERKEKRKKKLEEKLKRKAKEEQEKEIIEQQEGQEQVNVNHQERKQKQEDNKTTHNKSSTNTKQQHKLFNDDEDDNEDNADNVNDNVNNNKTNTNTNNNADTDNDNITKYTISILIPSSIVDNAQSKELRTYLIGQLSRTIGIFKVSEVIIFHDKLKSSSKDHLNFFIKNLQYLETPQYLRKTLFPYSQDLLTSGLMNPLDASHHLRIDQWCKYREGCVLNRPVKDDSSWVNIGLRKDCKINKKLPPNTRVTVKLNEDVFDDTLKFYTGVPVSMREPFEKAGIYWGYVVRVCERFEEVFDESIYGEKYDFVIGTSDKGENYRNVQYTKHKEFKHCLIVFGGIEGIEGMLDDDEHANIKGDDVNGMFDVYVNTCVGQGLRTIRTEEAIMITLSVLKPELDKVKGM